MSGASPIRVATAILSERIFAGRMTKDGRGFKEPRYDVTSDVLKAIHDKVGIGKEVGVVVNGVEQFRIAVLPPQSADSVPDVERLREALQALESACDDLAATRSRETYLSMVDHDHATPQLAALDEARRNARAALSLPITQRDEQGDQWQDIASAPDDGTLVLVVGGRHTVASVVKADGDWWRMAMDGGFDWHPTHWMPLPKPPSIEQGDQDGGEG